MPLSSLEVVKRQAYTLYYTYSFSFSLSPSLPPFFSQTHRHCCHKHFYEIWVCVFYLLTLFLIRSLFAIAGCNLFMKNNLQPGCAKIVLLHHFSCFKNSHVSLKVIPVSLQHNQQVVWLWNYDYWQKRMFSSSEYRCLNLGVSKTFVFKSNIHSW